MSPEYHHLFSASVLFTDQLYGDNVCQKSKEIQNMNRLSRQLNNRGRGGFARGRGRGGQAQLTMLNGYNQSQRNSTNSKTS